MSTTIETEFNLDDLEAVAKAATPGPWERGDRWRRAGVSGMFGPGKCNACKSGAPIVWEGRGDINGKMMHTHIHQDEQPWYDLGIYSADPGPDLGATVVVETDEYGGCSDGDALFITTFDPPTILALLRRLRDAEAPR